MLVIERDIPKRCTSYILDRIVDRVDQRASRLSGRLLRSVVLVHIFTVVYDHKSFTVVFIDHKSVIFFYSESALNPAVHCFHDVRGV